METQQNHLTIPVIKIPHGRLAMWILIAGELVIFGGLICFYLLNRIRYPHWGDMAAHTNTFIGALNTVVLLLSSYTVVRAHQAALKLDVAKVRLWLTCTLLGGVMFLVDKSIEYAHEISEGFTFTSPKTCSSRRSCGFSFLVLLLHHDRFARSTRFGRHDSNLHHTASNPQRTKPSPCRVSRHVLAHGRFNLDFSCSLSYT